LKHHLRPPANQEVVRALEQQKVVSDMFENLLQNSHSPQASAWGDSRRPILKNRFNGFRGLNQSSYTAKFSLRPDHTLQVNRWNGSCVLSAAITPSWSLGRMRAFHWLPHI